MTTKTNRNDVKPMLRLIAPVVILLGLGGAMFALEGIGAGYFACGDGPFGHTTSRYLLVVDGVILAGCSLALFGLVVSAGCGLVLVGLVVCSVARLTMRMQPVFGWPVLVKLRSWKISLALHTGFCLNSIRHDLTSSKVVFQGRLPYRAGGSFYYMSQKLDVNKENV